MRYPRNSTSNQGQTSSFTINNEFLWRDGAVQDKIYHDSDTSDGNTITSITTSGLFGANTKVFRTSYTLNAAGQVTGAAVLDGIPKTSSYVLDAAGQIIRHDESRDSDLMQAAPHEVFYRFGGKQIGMVGNNGTAASSYNQSITDRSRARPDQTQTTAGLFRDGTQHPGSYADFAQSYDSYTSQAQGAGAGSYTVREGESLQSIAAGLYGDANLWYKLAEANGLSAGSSLSAGQSLILPAGVTKTTHNAGTFKPYNPADALGDTLPTTPKPPKNGNNCGALGVILLAVVAIAVVAISGGITVPVY